LGESALVTFRVGAALKEATIDARELASVCPGSCMIVHIGLEPHPIPKCSEIYPDAWALSKPSDGLTKRSSAAKSNDAPKSCQCLTVFCCGTPGPNVNLLRAGGYAASLDDRNRGGGKMKEERGTSTQVAPYNKIALCTGITLITHLITLRRTWWAVVALCAALSLPLIAVAQETYVASEFL
jgi:hypothetical protein